MPTQKTTTQSKEQVKALINKDIKGLLKVMLKKADLTEQDIVEGSIRSWIVANLDLLDTEDLNRFKHLNLHS